MLKNAQGYRIIESKHVLEGFAVWNKEVVRVKYYFRYALIKIFKRIDERASTVMLHELANNIKEYYRKINVNAIN